MNVRDILEAQIRLSPGETVVLQPSLTDLLREHYARIAGTDEGRRLAELHVAALEALEAPAAEPAIVPEPAAAEPPVADPLRATPDKTAARTVAMAIVLKRHRDIGEPCRLEELKADLSRWQRDPQCRAIYPALALPDSEGGFSSHDESRTSLRSILRGLAADGLVTATDRGYEPAIPIGPAKSAGPDVSEPKAESPDAAAPKDSDPLGGLKEFAERIGIDVKVGGIDLVKGARKAGATGTVLPLAIGLASAVLGAVVAMDADREA